MALETFNEPVSEVQLSRPLKLVGRKTVMFPLTDLARIWRGRAPVYVGIERQIEPTEPVLALIRMGFSAGFLAEDALQGREAFSIGIEAGLGSLTM